MRVAILCTAAIMALGAITGAHALATPAPASPAATAACDFPPVSTMRLREIERDVAEHPIPTPTVYSGGSWSSEIHQFPYPPPSGEPLDDATLASIRTFLSEYTQCLVDGPILVVYGAWTEEYLRIGLGQRQAQGSLDPMIAILEATPDLVFPHPGLDLLLLRAWRIESGHVIAVVQIVPTPEFWTLYLAPHDGSWRIDDLWDFGDRPMDDGPGEGSLTGPIYATPVPVEDNRTEITYGTPTEPSE